MKNVVIFALLLLFSGAFINLIVRENFDITTMAAGDEHAQLMWGVIDCGVILVCFFHCRQLVRVASRQPWIIAFVGWATLSLTWSDDPQLTARRILGLICTAALGLFLGMKLEMKELLRLLAWAMAFAVITSFIAAIFFPSFGTMNDLGLVGWRGVFAHKNELGTKMGVATIVFSCLLWEERKNRLIYLMLLFASVALLLLSRSMTSLIVTAMALSIGLYRSLRLRPVQKVAFVAIASLVGLPATVYLQSRTDSILAMMGRDSSLTGRIPLWQYSADAILHRPLLGAGWDAFWVGEGGDRIRNMVHWAAPHAHNGFLEISLNIGLVGLVLFLLLNWSCLRCAVRYSNDTSQPFRLWPLLFYCYYFFSNFTEAPPVDRHTLNVFLLVAISVSTPEARGIEAIQHEQDDEYVTSGIAPDSGMMQESR
jgi:exopolysaccharide production protein ExoQ